MIDDMPFTTRPIFEELLEQCRGWGIIRNKRQSLCSEGDIGQPACEISWAILHSSSIRIFGGTSDTIP